MSGRLYQTPFDLVDWSRSILTLLSSFWSLPSEERNDVGAPVAPVWFFSSLSSGLRRNSPSRP